MRIHRAETTSALRRRIQTRLQAHWPKVAMLGAALTVAFLAGLFFQRYGLPGAILQSTREAPRIAKNRLRAQLAPPPALVRIDIDHEAFQKLAYKRNLALERGRLVTEADDYVPASLSTSEESVKIKMRLKGDWLDHLQGEKWSYRVNVKQGNTVFGMKRFSLQHPGTRKFLAEWLYHQALAREGLASLRYHFVQLNLNGKDLGLYALEEHFGKRLVEHNQRREGPIVRFNEDLFWQEKFDQIRPFQPAIPSGSGSYQASQAEVFTQSSQLADPKTAIPAKRAISLLESFRQGLALPRDVFDVSLLGTFFALSDLLGAEHGARWHNLRFYLNPITSRLEPIGFDGEAGHQISSLSPFPPSLRDPNTFGIRAALFKDAEVFEAYIAALERMSQPDYLDQLFADLEPDLTNRLRLLHKEFPSYSLSRSSFYRNADFLRSALQPAQALRAFLLPPQDDLLPIELGNLQALPIEVLELTCGAESFSMDDRDLNQAPDLNENRLILEGRRHDAPIDYRQQAFPAAASNCSGEKEIVFRLLGAKTTFRQAVLEVPRLSPALTALDLSRRPSNPEPLPWIEIDSKSKRINVLTGSWSLEEPLTLPKGFRVIINAGTKIDLRQEASIVTFSPVEIRGTEEDPVLIYSSDGTGQGFVALEAEEQSTLEHVTFQNLSNPQDGPWSLTGAVTFYRSPLRCLQCRFLDSRAEDSLNIVSTSYEIEDSFFAGSASDALDGDFTKGYVHRTTFADSTNDAFDISGSWAELEDVRFLRSGDKALSAGENSRLEAEGLEVETANIGVAAKDLSTVSIDGIDMSQVRIGFTVFQKKPEFGPASLEVKGSRLTQIEEEHILEKGSSLLLNGKSVPAARENVRKLFYGDEDE